MKTILFLDANDTIKDAVLYAKSCGYRVVTCDNIPSHSIHKLADRAYFISTYDIEGLSKIVEDEQVDGVIYFASAHGLYGASHLIEKYNFPGIPYSVESIFNSKNKFRTLLEENGFDCPAFQAVTSYQDIDFTKLRYPVIVKPAESAGGNVGITKVNSSEELSEAFQCAFESSFNQIVLIESFIESNFQVNGDCLIVDGEVKLAFLGRHLYSSKKSIIPYATMFSPSVFSDDMYEKIKQTIQRLVDLVHLKSGILNVELRVGTDGKIYFIEVNPRHSGNQIYRLMNESYSIDLSEVAVKLAIGEPLQLDFCEMKGNYAYVILYSTQDGELNNIQLSQTIKDHTLFYQQFVHSGDSVRNFKLLKDRLSLIHLSYDKYEDLDYVVKNIREYYTVNIKEIL